MTWRFLSFVVGDSQLWVWYIVAETHFRCDTAGRELWLAILSLLLCPKTDRNICIGKQSYVFNLSNFKKWRFDVSFLILISVSTVILTLGKVEFLNRLINLRNILFIEFVKFEIKQWISAYQDQFCAWLSLARSPTETAREFKFFSGFFCKRNGFIFLLSASRTSPINASTKLFLYLTFCSAMWNNSQNFPPF